ncbi:subtilisin-like protease [Colletotrichum tofieldiae]|uniref:Subtilisin-like protease n=1 Tax=Colletotrichum tofieldiae TaxID=708197 RepID=A0A166XUV3_9PEZI|nr:subtilisin-like protease [Colletotrichum tofieldiae]
MANFNLVAPTIQQGAGLSFLLEKSSWLTGMMLHSPSTNPSDNNVTYSFTNIPAGCAVSFREGVNGSSMVDYVPQSFSSKVRFPQGNQMTVRAGASLNVTLLVAPPSVRYLSFLTFFGIASSANETSIISYMGIAYNYSSTPVVGLTDITEEQRANALTPSRDPLSAPQVFANGDKDDIGNYWSFSFQYPDYPPIRQFGFDIVRARANFIPTWYGFDPDVKLDNLTETTMMGNGTVAGVSILASNMIQNGWVPQTNYQTSWSYRIFRCHSLERTGYFKGDNDPDSWESWMSSVIDALEDAFEPTPV